MRWRNLEQRSATLLLACGLGTVALALAALLRFPLLSTYTIQIHTLEFQAERDGLLGPLLVGAIVIWFACYSLGFWALSRLNSEFRIQNSEAAALPEASLTRRHLTGARWFALVLLPPLLCAALLLFIHPTSSLDVYDYLYRGHMAARYGANNFVQTPEDVRQLDRLYWYTAWRSATSAYGPLWEGLSIVVAQLAGRDLLALILGFKLLSLFGWLLTALAIGLVTTADARLMALFVWLWNPLALWELVGAAHNDGWMLAVIVLAFAALRTRAMLALLLISAAALLKYAAALLWPLVLVVGIRSQQSGVRSFADHMRFLVRAALVCTAFVVLAYAPWWAGPAMLRQFADRQELFNSTPLAVVYALRGDNAPEAALQTTLSRVGLVLLALGVIVASINVARRPSALLAISAALWLWFMLICSPWFQPWYLSWPLALWAGFRIQDSEVRSQKSEVRSTTTTGTTLTPQVTTWPTFALFAALCCGALLSYPANAALRPILGWPADGAAWQAFLVALLLLPPLLIVPHTMNRCAAGAQGATNNDEVRAHEAELLTPEF
jgi:hypothetical protein